MTIGYHLGHSNGRDHGIRLRAELKLPVNFCPVCRLTHDDEGAGYSGVSGPGLPDNLVTSSGDPVVYEESYVVHNA